MNTDPRFRIYHTIDQDALDRVGVAGANERNTGLHTALLPKISRKDYDLLMAMQGPTAYGVMDGILDSVPGLSRASKEVYMSTRRVMRRLEADGSTTMHVIPDVPQAMRDYDIPVDAKFGAQEPVYGPDDYVKQRKYTLQQFFSDQYILAKYALPLKVVETVKRMATSKPDHAAKMLQDAIMAQQPPHDVKVTASEYSKTKSSAKNAIKMLSGGIPDKTNSLEAEVIGNKFYLYGPGGPQDWHVVGPLQYAYEVKDIYRMVMTMGTFEPMFLLGYETVLLGIDIWNGKHYEASEMSYHMASSSSPPLPNRSSMEASSHMSFEMKAKVVAMVDRVLPVESELGQVASAVRVSDKHILINSHVIAGAENLTVNGESFSALKSMSRDVWAAKLDGAAEAWVLREPEAGELAILCYRNGDEVQYSSPVTVQSCTDGIIRTSLAKDVVPGMSGAAVVALADYALLGIHSAVTRTDGIAYHFGNAQFSELLEADATSQVSRDASSEEAADSVMSHFRRRGLGTLVRTAIRSLVPVYVGHDHVGDAVNLGSKVVTTCDADLPLRLGVGRVPARFTTVPRRFQYETEMELVDTPYPTLTRNPEYYESVYIIAKDDTGPYFSQETRVVHIGIDSKMFTLDARDSDLPLRGGLVVAKTDGAVLGQCGHKSATVAVGNGFVCYPLRVEVRHKSDEKPAELLQRKFPFLNVGFWPEGLVEEVVTHSSVGGYVHSSRRFNAGAKPLANIGDNVAKMMLYEKLRDQGVEHSQFQHIMQSLQSNVVFARVATKFEFASLLRTGGGASFTQESRAYADLTEALIGAVHLAETPETTMKFLETLGVVGVQSEATSPTESKEMVMRPSAKYMEPD